MCACGREKGIRIDLNMPIFTFLSWQSWPFIFQGFPVLFLRAGTAWRYIYNISEFLGVNQVHLPSAGKLRTELSAPVPTIPTEALDKLQVYIYIYIHIYEIINRVIECGL